MRHTIYVNSIAAGIAEQIITATTKPMFGARAIKAPASTSLFLSLSHRVARIGDIPLALGHIKKENEFSLSYGTVRV